MKILFNNKILALLVVIFLTACVNREETPTLVLPESEYVLGIGDRVNVTVYNHEKLSGTFVVNTNGEIAFPLLEKVKAQGITSQALEKNIKDGLHPDYLNDPKVSVEILNRRNIFILGEVERPGKYEYVPDMSLLQAVATAEGYTPRADEKRATIKRKSENVVNVIDVTQDEVLKPEDVIIIKRRWF